MAEPRIPTAEMLKRFLLGDVTLADWDWIARYVESHPGSLPIDRPEPKYDRLSEDLRGLATAPPDDTPQVTQLIRSASALGSFSDPTADRSPTGTPSEETQTGQQPLLSRTNDDADAESEEDQESELYQRMGGPPGSPGGACLGQFRIIKLLGKGGMGMVFEAVDEQLGRSVALKVMLPKIASSKSARDRFLREARTAATVAHDNLVPIYQVTEDKGIPLIAMPLLHGRPLDQVTERGPIRLDEAVMIARGVAEGLSAAHTRGLIHRDIKPSNIWLEEKDDGTFFRARILDFGLARQIADDDRVTKSGAVIGTPAFMSPEQGRGEAVDHRTDLFSLGVVLYLMTTGRRPFKGGGTMASLTSLAVDTPTAPQLLNPEIPDSLARLTVRLLEKSPDQRPGTAREVTDALGQILGQLRTPIIVPVAAEVPAPPVPAADPWQAIDDPTDVVSTSNRPVDTTNRTRKSRSGVLAVAVSLLLIVAGGFALYKFVFDSKTGTLVVEVADPVGMAQIAESELELLDSDGRIRHRFRASLSDRYDVTPGSYRVRISSADRLELSSDTLQIRKGESVTVRVFLRPDNPIAAMKDPPSVPSPEGDERAVATSMLKLGCIVQVNGEATDIVSAERLPPGRIRLTYANFNSSSIVQNDDLKALASCRQLAAVGLIDTRVTDDGLAYLRDHSHLGHLYLQGSAFTSRGVEHLRRCTGLLVVGIAGTSIDDSAVDVIAEWKNLQRLYAGRTKMTLKGYQEVARRLPKCEVHWEGGSIVPPQTDRPFLSAAQRTALDFLMSVGGRIECFSGARPEFVTQGKPLPQGPFRIDRIEIHGDGPKVLSDADVAKLTDLPVVHSGMSIGYGVRITPAGLKSLSRIVGLNSIQYLTLGGPVVKDDWLSSVREFSKLKSLTLQQTAVTGRGIAQILKPLRLQSVTIEDSLFSDDDLAALAEFSAIQSVTVNRTRVSETGVNRFIGLVPECWVHRDGKTTEARKLPADVDRRAAEWIVMRGGTVQLDGQSRVISAVADLPKSAFRVSQVHLSGKTGVNDDGIKILENCRALESVVLDQTAVTDAGVRSLPIPSIREIRLDVTKISNNALVAFQGSSQLRGMYLTGTAVDDIGLASLSDCSGIQEIGLGATKVTDDGLVRFASTHPGLIFLSIEDTAVTDQGLKAFRNCLKLEQLLVGNSKITDSGISPFVACTRLRRLGLRGTNVTARKVRELSEALPFCLIDHESVSPTPPDFAVERNEARWVLGFRPKSIEVLTKDGAVEVVDESVLPNQPFFVTRIDFSRSDKVPISGIQRLSKLYRLRKIVFAESHFNDQGLRSVSEFPVVEILDLRKSAVTKFGFAKIAELKTLRELIVTDTQFDDQCVSALRGNAELTHLWADGTVLTGQGVSAMSELRGLQGLSLRRVGGVPGNLKSLQKLLLLRSLDLEDTRITSADTVEIGRIAVLRELNVSGCPIGDDALSALGSLKQLQQLNLKKTQVTEAGVRKLAESLPSCRIDHDRGVVLPKIVPPAGDRSIADWVLTTGGKVRVFGNYAPITRIDALPTGSFDLEEIDLESAKFDEKELSRLRLSAKLKSLNLSRTTVGDSGLAYLKDMVSLERLQLYDTRIGDDGLVHLKKLVGLKRLSLGRTHVTNSGMAHLIDLPRLEELRLYNTTIGDEGIRSLERLDSLMDLSVKSTKVTQPALRRFSTSVPKCRIEWDGGVIGPKSK